MEPELGSGGCNTTVCSRILINIHVALTLACINTLLVLQHQYPEKLIVDWKVTWATSWYIQFFLKHQWFKAFAFSIDWTVFTVLRERSFVPFRFRHTKLEQLLIWVKGMGLGYTIKGTLIKNKYAFKKMQVWATPRLILLFHLLLQRFDMLLGYKM